MKSLFYNQNEILMLVWVVVTMLTVVNAGHSLVNFPNPNNGDCDGTWVCDPDHLLSKQAKDRLWGVIQLIEKKYEPACKKGYQVGVAIIKHMHGGNTLYQAERYAKSLHDQWGVGHRDCQSGIMMFLAIGDRHMYISTGRDARVRLTDHLATQIIDEMKYYLKNENYDDALVTGVELIGEVLENGSLPRGIGEYVILFVILLAIGFTIYGFVKSRTEKRRYKDCLTKLSKIEEMKAKELADQYEAAHCPICLEDFEEDTDTKLLPCGHSFCSPCIDRWLEETPTCPICRFDLRNRDRDGSGPYNGGEKMENRTGMITDFQLRQLQMQYPYYVTDHMLLTFMSPVYHQPWTHFEEFVQLDPSMQVPTPSSGDNSSFGGGSSFNGGGSGGSW
eukprot:TRINITY_DN8530_c0_g1_i1.p1 TRINITY_DN8530_c0_g1~~TRINITY_DN8530_c0_g1_i1.p1  ORF type:complete len:390 (+),score=94.56 TRINITY_DN8530_c0_g1_i1:25-1194(+)